MTKGKKIMRLDLHFFNNHVNYCSSIIAWDAPLQLIVELCDKKETEIGSNRFKNQFRLTV